jgi:hypothetical protein
MVQLAILQKSVVVCRLWMVQIWAAEVGLFWMVGDIVELWEVVVCGQLKPFEWCWLHVVDAWAGASALYRGADAGRKERRMWSRGSERMKSKLSMFFEKSMLWAELRLWNELLLSSTTPPRRPSGDLESLFLHW